MDGRRASQAGCPRPRRLGPIVHENPGLSAPTLLESPRYANIRQLEEVGYETDRVFPIFVVHFGPGRSSRSLPSKPRRAMQSSSPTPKVRAPATIIGESATIKTMDGRVLREGSTGWTCYAGNEATGPMCNQAQWERPPVGGLDGAKRPWRSRNSAFPTCWPARGTPLGSATPIPLPPSPPTTTTGSRKDRIS